MFGISISGIRGAQKHLDVTSNNIANANSYGFKKSRAEFADIYANSVYTNTRTDAGMGTQNTVVTQQFAQGPLTGDTGSALDMAIQGNGFFVLSSEAGVGAGGAGALTYTRNGAFQVNNEGFIVTAMGDYVQGWDVNEVGNSTSLDLSSTHGISLPADTGAPAPSRSIGIGVNLPADAPTLEQKRELAGDFKDWDGSVIQDITVGGNGTNKETKVSPAIYGVPRTADNKIANDYHAEDIKYMQYYSTFDPKNAGTYSASTSQTIHDSLGRAHTLTYYMIKVGSEPGQANNTVWNVIPYVDGQPADVAMQNDGATLKDNPVMISVRDGDSSINGSNLFGFQIIFGSDGEVARQVPESVQLVNPVSGEALAPDVGPDGEVIEADTTGTKLANSLRHSLFGYPNSTDATQQKGSLEEGGDVKDLTFEGTPGRPAPYSGDGSLHKDLGVGIDPYQNMNITFHATQFGSSNFTVSESPWNDGYSTGVLLGVSVSEDGIIQCEYSNGRIENIAKLAMVDFTNVQGLTKIGDTQWKESSNSGKAKPMEAQSGSAGSIIGSNLEMSNVDLTSELVELITAQRNYQANAQSLQTQNTVMDAILNVR